MKPDRSHVEIFKLEAEDLLSEIEDCALDLEQDPSAKECINRLFRHFHTLKGSGAMFGFDDISGFTHHIESVLDSVREGKLAMTGDLIGLILLARDKIKGMLDAADGESQVDGASLEHIVAKFKNLLPVSDPLGPPSDSVTDLPAPSKRYRIRFLPDPGITAKGMDPAAILDELRDLGEADIRASTENLPPLEELEPDKCYLSWEIFLTTRHGRNAISDVFIFVESDSRIEIIRDTEAPASDDGEIPETPVPVVAERSAPTRRRPPAERIPKASDSIRVSSEKLDRLVNLVGELVITQSRLTQVASRLRQKDLSDPVEQVERLSGELRDCALEIRMVPIGTLFGKFRRLVRDLSAELDKEIDLVIAGTETELDKTIIERLNDPLVHLIRNCIDHGIEKPEERRRNGKPEKGSVSLLAAYEGPRVIITVSDDGRGIDPESIRKKAIEKGMIPETAETRTEELFSLMFLPGFSTATEITSVSGRGVGMDVVKKEINALGGTVGIRSEKGAGTEFRLSLPLTLAIIEGLSVVSGKRQFVIPIELIDGCAETDSKMFDEGRGRNMIRLADELIPFVRLRDVFHMPAVPNADGHIIVVEAENIRIGIVVDDIRGNIQTVIKPLDRLYRNAPGISGASIMGDGSVALIVDLPGIVRIAKQGENTILRHTLKV